MANPSTQVDSHEGSEPAEVFRGPQSPETVFTIADFVPGLREQFEQHPLNPKKIMLATIPVQDPQKHGTPIPAGMDRRSLSLTDGKDVWLWQTDSLQSLFRGNKQPPVLGDYPEAYEDTFLLLELHALEISKVLGDRRDAEMKEIYSALRRRPDGRSLGFVHDYMWQAAALVLGTRSLSQAEFEAIMMRLERSCRTFEQGSTSRNYIASLRTMLDRASDS
jgi:hypothetical protein